jgi:hypothetical protein
VNVVVVWVGLHLNPHPFQKPKGCGTQMPVRLRVKLVGGMYTDEFEMGWDKA